MEHRCLFAAVPLEQCTSWPVAEYKAQLYSGNSLLDLTGGLGVDDTAFAGSFRAITSLDPDSGLNAIFRFNARQMGISNISRIDSTAEEFLASHAASFDLVYADPDRRASGQRAVADAGNYRPDIFAIMGQYPELTRRWLVKLSPMTDLDWIRQRTPFPCRFTLFSLKGELKEILLETGPDTVAGTVIADVSRRQLLNDQDIRCTDTGGKPLFVEALPATIKAGFHKTMGPRCGLKPENAGGTFLTGQSLPPEGFFRVFQLQEILHGSLNNMAARLKEQEITSANITVREFTNSADETRNILKMKDGGDVYLFFTGKGKEKICFVCVKPDQDFFSELAR